MDLPPVNFGPLHQFHSQNGAEARAIRDVMIQKREAAGDIAQFVENQGGLEEDLVRAGVALAPHTHSLLPNEVLSHIFIFLALGYETVMFPNPKHTTPPQLVVSCVCSRWRSVALHTPELWSETYLIFQRSHHDHHVRFHRQWVSRARTFPVTLSIAFNEWLGSELGSTLRNILLPIQVKRLSLCLAYEELMALSTLPDAALSGVSEFEVVLTFPDLDVSVDVSGPHPLITRLRSVTFLWAESGDWIDQLHPSFPWSQLRSLKFETYTKDLGDVIIGILRQTPMLEVLSLQIYDTGMWEQVIMPSLRTLTMELALEAVNGTEVDNVLRSFMCPSLAELTLSVRDSWTCDTFDILKRRYNMRELRKAHFFGPLALPASTFLRGAPMLHSLLLQGSATMDEEALIGVSNGTLGRFLRRLAVDTLYDLGEVLDMVEARKKTVDRLIENGCSWREEVTSLKDVVVHTKDGKDYEERVTALEEAGIHITIFIT